MEGQTGRHFHVANHRWTGQSRTYLQLELAGGFRRIDMQDGKLFHGAAPGRDDHQFDEACSGLAMCADTLPICNNIDRGHYAFFDE
jgi:hypothetical protein